MPPSSGFGWSSLCDRVRLPIEGEHFDIDQDVNEENIKCERCRNRLGESNVAFTVGSMACVNGCLVRFGRNENGVIIRAEKVCGGMLHDSLQFEPDSFSGNLNEQVDEVCSECWDTYVDHQWTDRDEGAELLVEFWGDDSRSEYFASSAEAIQSGGEAVLRLMSENGLKKDIRSEQIESITLTRARNINY